jgi:RNA polymerase sigma-70 factor (ECF subfamily)
MVLAAGDRESRTAREALAELCEAYWSPIYAYVRSRGHPPDRARDLTQAYFALLLEKDFLSDARPEAGRFRAFLLTTAKRMLLHEAERAQALKRGAGRTPISLDVDEAEVTFRQAAAPGDDPERSFERKWALTVVQRALNRIREDFVSDGKARHFEYLKGTLTGTLPGRSYREVAEALEMTEPAVKMAVARLRKRYGQALRDEVAETVDSPERVDDEVRHLLTILAS